MNNVTSVNKNPVSQVSKTSTTNPIQKIFGQTIVSKSSSVPSSLPIQKKYDSEQIKELSLLNKPLLSSDEISIDLLLENDLPEKLFNRSEVSHFHTMLSHIEKNDKILSPFKQLKQYQEKIASLANEDDLIKASEKIKNISKEVHQQVMNLKVGDSQVVYVAYDKSYFLKGYIVEFIKKNNTTYDIRLFHIDSPLGVSYDNKIKNRSFKTYVNVDQEQIREPIFSSLLELNSKLKIQSNNIKTETIFFPFAHLDEKYQFTLEPQEWLKESSQPSLNNLLKALLRTRCEKKQFKTLLHKMKLQVLIDFYNHNKNKLALTDQTGSQFRSILEKAAESLMRGIPKFKGIDKLDPYAASLATCLDILQKIEECKKSVELREKKIEIRYDPEEYLLSRKNTLNSLSSVKDRQEEKLQPIELPVPFLNLKADSISDVFNIQKKIFSKFEKIQENSVSDQVFFLDFAQLIALLPMPTINDPKAVEWIDRMKIPQLWESASVDDLKKVVSYLEKFIVMYGKVAFEKDEFLQMYATSLRAIVQMHFLCVMIDKKLNLSQEASIGFYKMRDFSSCLSQFIDVCYFDHKLYDQIAPALSYIQANKTLENPILFDHEYAIGIEKFNSTTNYSYWNQLIGKFPEIKDFSTSEPLSSGQNDRWIHSLESSINIEDNPLKKSDLTYIYSYRHSVYTLAQLLLYARTPLPLKAIIKPVTNDDKNFLFNKSEIPVASETINLNSPQHRKGYLNKICSDEKQLSFQQFKRIKNKNKEKESEGNLLDHQIVSEKSFQKAKKNVGYKFAGKRRDIIKDALAAEYKGDSFITQLVRACTKGKTAPFQLMYEISSYPSCVEEPYYQAAFFSFFFHSPIVDGKEKIGVFKQLQDNASLREACLSFIQAGVDKCSYLEEEKRIYHLRFYLEFGYRIAANLKDENISKNFVNALKEINCEWISKGAPLKDLCVLHRYRLLLHSITPIEKLSLKDIAEVYESYFASRLIPDGDLWKMPDLIHKESAFILNVTAHCHQNELFSKDTALLDWFKPLLVNLKQDSKAIEWQFDKNILTSGKWNLDLINGTISSNHKPIKFLDSKDQPWEKDSDSSFNELFLGKTNFTYFSSGENNFYFVHPSLGRFEIIRKNYFEYVIRANLLENTTFEFRKGNTVQGIKKYTQPNLFSKDYRFWYRTDKSIEKLNPDDIFAYLIDAKSQKMSYGITKKGIAVAVDEKGNKIGDLTVEFGPEKDPLLELFEDSEYILFHYLKGVPEKIILPRFVSPARKPLMFLGEKMIWSENKNYYLSAIESNGVLESLKGGLYLCPLKPKDPWKLLLPCQKIDKDRFYRIKNSSSVDPFKEKTSRETGSFTYYAYDIVDGKPTSDLLEARLYLSYVYLTQGHYQDGIDILRKIKPVEHLSMKAHQFLEAIQKFDVNDPHGSALILISVLVRLNDAKYHQHSFEFTYDQSCYVFVELGNYLQSLQNISWRSRLSIEEEIVFLQLLMNHPRDKVDLTFFKNRLSFLQRDPNSQYEKDYVQNREPEAVERFYWEFHFNHSHYSSIEPSWRRTKVKEILEKEGNEIPCFIEANNGYFPHGLREILDRAKELIKTSNTKGKEDLRFLISLWQRQVNVREPLDVLNWLLCAKIDPKWIVTASLDNILDKYESEHENVKKTTSKSTSKENVDNKVHKEIKPLLYDHSLETVSKFGKNVIPLQPKLPDVQSHNDLLTKWSDEFLKIETKKLPSINLNIPTLQNEFEDGLRQNESIPEVSVKGDLNKLIEKVDTAINDVDKEFSTKTNYLIALANKPPENTEDNMLFSAEIGGGVGKIATLDDCMRALFSFDYRQYRMLNSQLTKEEAEELMSLTLELEAMKSHKKQYARVKKGLLKIQKQAKLKSEEQVKQLSLELHKELLSHFCFDIMPNHVQAIFIVFCGEMGIIPFKKQVESIHHMLKKHLLSDNKKDNEESFHDTVFQLIMGAGKTSVIATLSLFLIAEMLGALPIFVVPSSLFDTVKYNISDSLWKAFRKKIYPLSLDRADLSDVMEKNGRKINPNIKEIRKLIDRCIEHREPLIVTPKTIHCLRLEYITTIFTFEITSFEQEKLEDLAYILDKINKKSHFLLDEVDQQKNAFFEVNYKLDNCENLPEEETAFIHHIFNLLLTSQKPIKVGDESYSLVDFVNLKYNQQHLLNGKCLEHLVPCLAELLAEEYEPLKEHIGSYKESYKCYVTGILLSDSIEDNNFLEYLKKLEKENPEALNLIEFSKEFLYDILPLALSKVGNEFFGDALHKNIFKVVRYRSVGTPGTTQIGYYPLEQCFYYMWLAAKGISPVFLKEIAKSWKKEAQYQADQQNIHLQKTERYKLFKKLTNCTFDQVLNGDVNEIARALSEKTPEILGNLMNLMHEVMPSKITITEQYVSSNGSDLTSLPFAKHGMSGDPWNVDGFEPSMREGYRNDKGTEGRIVHRMVERAHMTPVCPVKFSTVKVFLDDTIGKHPTPTRVRGIIEAGGHFERFATNYDVAKEIALWILDQQERKTGLVDPSIEGVLFFENDNLCFLKLTKNGDTYDEEIKDIGGSDNLKSQKLNVNKYFVYYDQGHVVGSNIPQKTDAINIVTVSLSTTHEGSSNDSKNIKTIKGTTRSLLTQAIMRLRKYLNPNSQDIMYVISQEDNASLGGSLDKPIKVLQIIDSVEKTQQLTKKKHIYRHYEQLIDGLPKQKVLESMITCTLKGDWKKLKEIKDNKEVRSKYVLSTPRKQRKPSPIQEVDSLTILQNRLNVEKKKEFGIHPIKKDIQEKSEKLQKYINDNKKLLPDKSAQPVDYSSIQNSELEIENENEKELENENEKENEIENEWEMEVELHQQSGGVVEEKELTEKDFEELLNFGAGTKNQLANLVSISAKIAASNKSVMNKMKGVKIDRFSKVFHEELLGTKNLFELQNSIFSRNHKPYKQILVIRKKDGSYIWIGVTILESNKILKMLPKFEKYHGNTWLIQPDGSEFVKHATPFPMADEKAQKGLFEINILLGNIAYLDKRLKETKLWLGMDEAVRKEKLNFLKLKACINPIQKALLKTSLLFNAKWQEENFPKKTKQIPPFPSKGPSTTPKVNPPSDQPSPPPKVFKPVEKIVPEDEEKEEPNPLISDSSPVVQGKEKKVESSAGVSKPSTLVDGLIKCVAAGIFSGNIHRIFQFSPQGVSVFLSRGITVFNHCSLVSCGLGALIQLVSYIAGHYLHQYLKCNREVLDLVVNTVVSVIFNCTAAAFLTPSTVVLATICVGVAVGVGIYVVTKVCVPIIYYVGGVIRVKK